MHKVSKSRHKSIISKKNSSHFSNNELKSDSNVNNLQQNTVTPNSGPIINVSELLTKKNIFTIPNAITLIRIILAPFFMFALMDGLYLQAFILLVVAGLTDLLDGFIARKFNMQTPFGAIMDPVADVTLMSCTVIALLLKFHFPSWFALIILSREVLIIVGGILCLSFGKITLTKANKIGKYSRFFQLIAIISYVSIYFLKLGGYWLISVYVLMYIAAILTTISIIMYLSRAYSLIKKT